MYVTGTYTGKNGELAMYDKKYFQNQVLELVRPLKKYYDGGKVKFGSHCTWYENLSADTEAFARPLWGLVPFWSGGGSDSDFEKLYIEGFTEGSDANSAGYWGDCHDRDQRFVEMAAIAYAILFAPDKVWEPLSDSAKGKLEKWLLSINDKEVCDSNWTFFRILVNIALKKAGRGYSQERLESDLARIDDFYMGNGWYRDGIDGQTDYYIAFAIHFYSLIYAAVMEKDDPKRSAVFKDRACEFAKDFIYWFDEDGEALPYGRSLTYRFAQSAFWSACIIAGVYPFSVGVMKGIIVRNIEAWLKKNVFNSEGILTVGYDYANLIMAEHYNAHGSPYWGLKAYAFLMLPDDHVFWNSEAEPMPPMEKLRKIEKAEMIISRRNGRSVMYPCGRNTAFGCGQIIPKYLKFAYSAHFGFNVMHSCVSAEEAACDSMLLFELDGLMLPRRHFTSCRVHDDRLVIEWSPFKGINVKTTVLPADFGHMREHEITSEYDCTAYDMGFAVSESDDDKCRSGEDGSAWAQNSFQRCEVKSEECSACRIVRASPNTNIRYPKTVIPAVIYSVNKGVTRVKTVIYDNM